MKFVKKSILYLTRFNSILDLIIAPFLSWGVGYASLIIYKQYEANNEPLLFFVAMSCFVSALFILINFIEKFFDKISPRIIEFLLKRRR